MTKVIVTAHGQFATGLASTISMVAGESFASEIIWIDFDETMSHETLANHIHSHIEPDYDYICLCDLQGGTPYKVLGELQARNNRVHVISGVNVPMLLTLIFSLSSPVDELIQLIVEEARRCIEPLVIELKTFENEEEDGI